MNLFSWEGLLALLLGGLYGAVFGAIPGLTATLAIALFIPIAFFLDPGIALPAIIAISSVAIFAGDVGSTVARIPGTPASAAYVDELYLLSRRTSPLYSLGLSALGSAVGGVIGTGVLVFSATGLASAARQFSSFEYFWIAALGLTAGVFAAGGRPVRAAVSLLLGLFLASIGVDPTLGYPRFDFGHANLMGGVNYIVVMIGLFGFSEVLEHLFRPADSTLQAAPSVTASPAETFFRRPLRLILRERGLVLRSSLVGVAIGFLPGAGADVGAWVAASLQKMRARGRSDDTADERVVLSGTTSNNAAVAGAWIPALSLGLPGDTITAIVLGVFLMKGITPGPLLFDQQVPMVWALYGAFALSSLVLLPAYGYMMGRLADRIVRVPLRLLLGVIALLCVVGAFAINNNPFDVWVMAAMGGLAFVLRRGGFPLAQVVLGMVLGPILEQNFMVSAIKSHWSLASFFDRPVGLLLMALTIGVAVVGLRLTRRRG